MFRSLVGAFLWLGIAGVPVALASTFVETKWEPTKSRDGEPIKFSIIVKTNNDDLIRGPTFPSNLPDWEYIRGYQSPSLRTLSVNGQYQAVQENEYTFILSPKRKGVLTIPAMDLSVGSKRYQSREAKIQVDDVPLGTNIGPKGPGRNVPKSRPLSPNIDPNSPWGPGVGGLPRDDEDPLMDDLQDKLEERMNQAFGQQQNSGPKESYDFEIPGEGRQTFFIKAVVKKKNVFLGEMIEVSYRAYTKTRNIREAEITKFPEFKGFLKEDLYFPKTFDPQPVLIKGQPFFEIELIRYALYPIKEGALSIDSMNFKVQISNHDSLVEALGYGGPAIPMEKSSPSVPILVKPLPIPKPESFTGAVGKFSMETLTPPKAAKTEQPFSLIINVAGTGNLKAIEAPKLSFPKEFDLTNIATHPGTLDQSGSGTIQFEYLLNPTAEGEVQIAESEWSYFDPEKAEYVKIKIPAMPITISKGSGTRQNPSADGTPAAEVMRWSELKAPPSKAPTVHISEIADPMYFGSHTAFGIHLLVLVGLLGALWKRRQREERETLLKTFPWTHLEEEFSANQKFSGQKLAEKLDLWTRLRMIGYFKKSEIEHGLHSESSRADFAEVLRQNLPPESYKLIDALKGHWAELDSMRFSGTATNAELASKAPFEKAQVVLKQIEKSLRKSEKKLYSGFQDEWS